MCGAVVPDEFRSGIDALTRRGGTLRRCVRMPRLLSGTIDAALPEIISAPITFRTGRGETMRLIVLVFVLGGCADRSLSIPAYGSAVMSSADQIFETDCA